MFSTRLLGTFGMSFLHLANLKWVMLSWKYVVKDAMRKRKVSYANAKMVGQAKYGDMPPSSEKISLANSHE